MDNTLVSVVIPTYNRANIIQRAIKSVIRQQYDNIEIIVVDDGSEDNTKEKVEQLDAENLRYVEQPNKGANAARNRGINEANGEIISFLDSDDELLPGYISQTLTLLRKSGDRCGGVFTAYKRVDHGSVIETVSTPNSEITLDELRVANVIGGLSCTTFRASVLNDVGGFDEKLASSQDYDLYLRVLRTYTMRGISEPLVTIHLDDDRISENIDRKICGHEQIVEKHREILSPKRIAHQHYVRGLLYGNKKELKLARSEFKTAMVSNPRKPLYTLHYILCFFGENLYSWAMSVKRHIRRVLKT